MPGQWVMKTDPYSRTSRFGRHLGTRFGRVLSQYRLHAGNALFERQRDGTTRRSRRSLRRVPEGGSDMTATEFATELKAYDLRIVRDRIVADDFPGVTWKPVVTGGQIDRARTLRKVIRERRDEIVRQVRIGAA
jgi:hypothetical protein